MYAEIHKYLVQHKKVSIPGIGSFVIKNKPANINNGILYAPEPIIQYNAETALADKNFYSYLAKELHIDEIEAIKNFHEYTYQLKNDSSKAEALILPGIGTLTKQADGSFDFVQENVLNDYYNSIKVEQSNLVENTKTNNANNITLKNEDFSNIDLEATEETHEIKDYWWIYAAILALIGVAAIVYKLQLLS